MSDVEFEALVRMEQNLVNASMHVRKMLVASGISQAQIAERCPHIPYSVFCHLKDGEMITHEEVGHLFCLAWACGYEAQFRFTKREK